MSMPTTGGLWQSSLEKILLHEFQSSSCTWSPLVLDQRQVSHFRLVLAIIEEGGASHAEWMAGLLLKG